jgi:hypothetical protein
VILLVVVIMLALFAVVGLTFVLYAESQAIASRVHKDGENPRKGDAEPELLLSFFLNQLIYDVKDNRTGMDQLTYSAMRGHSLTRTLTGYNSSANPANDGFYNGLGRMHWPRGAAGPADYYYQINYAQQLKGGTPPNPEAPLSAQFPGNNTYCGGANAPWTYPDLNSMFLAAQRPSDGAILIQSFHRPWLTQMFANNPLCSLRPSQQDHPQFPPMQSLGGDVKNLMGGPGFVDANGKYYNEDSIWMDLGYPIKFAPDGRRYKAMFAPLVLDLDNRLNLNVVGNIVNKGQHASNQGWGPWEMNPAQLTQATDPTNIIPGDNLPAHQAEWANLFLAPATTNNPNSGGRYGNNPAQAMTYGVPNPGNPPPNGMNAIYIPPPTPRFFSQVDYDGYNENGGGPTVRMNLPGQGFPKFGAGYGNYSMKEMMNHPSVYNVYEPQADDKTLGCNSNLEGTNMEAVLRYGDTGAPAMSSNLFQILPRNLTSPRIRRLITTISMDIDQPVMSAWVWNRATKSDWLTLNKGKLSSGNLQHPGAINFPTTLGVRPGTQPPTPYTVADPNLGQRIAWDSEFGSDWRSNNRDAPPPKHKLLQGSLGKWDYGRQDLNCGLPSFPPLNADGSSSDPLGAQGAMASRQSMAKNIFLRLCKLTNAAPCVDDSGNALPLNIQAKPGTPEYDALRWLAQLAVNIVDYIDEDDYSTPFNWNTNYTSDINNGWVFGVEVPHVVLNECSVTKDNSDPQNPKYDSCVKLLNPLINDPVRPDVGGKLTGSNHAFAWVPTAWTDTQEPNKQNQSKNGYGPYRVLLVHQGQNPTTTPGQGFDPTATNNSLGTGTGNPENIPAGPNDFYTAASQDPATMKTNTTLAAMARDFSKGPSEINVPPNGGAPQPQNQGFYVVASNNKGMGGANPDCITTELSFQGNGKNNNNQNNKPPVTFLLQRLCDPGRIPNSDPTKSDFNPYVTVDYMPNVADGQTFGRQEPYRANDDSGQSLEGNGKTWSSDSPWLVHMDRNLTSATEILQVSAVRPFELTHKFVGATKLASNTVTQGAPDPNDPNSTLGHLAPWFDQKTRLYRLFEFVTTHRLANGLAAAPGSNIVVNATSTREAVNLNGANLFRVGVVSRAGITKSGTPWVIIPGSRLIVGGNEFNGMAAKHSGQMVEVLSCDDNSSFTAVFARAPGVGSKVQVCTLSDRLYGRVNINTIFPDSPVGQAPYSTVFRAMCDAQPSNQFTQTDVDTVYRRMLASRSPGLLGGGSNSPSLIGPNDRPFKPLSTGYVPVGDLQYPNGQGIEDTIFRSSGNSRLFDITPAGGPSPYLQQSLLNKIYNNITLRSNAFAVWVTVGFFEVDANNRLMTEIGKAEGRNVRHRMFSIIDRSVFAKSYGGSGSTGSNLIKPVTPAMGGSVVQLFPASMQDIHQGCSVELIDQQHSNSVRVSGVNGNTITAAPFQNLFPEGSTVSYTSNEQQFDSQGNPLFNPDGTPMFRQVQHSAQITTPVTGAGQGQMQVGDPSFMKNLKPGTQLNIQGGAPPITVSVIRVDPMVGQPNSFFATVPKVLNVGTQTIVSYYLPVNDPANPGPQKVWNTRDDHRTPEPILFYSVID